MENEVVENQERKMIKSRIELVIDSPFFGTKAMKLKIRADSGIPTMATDGKEIIYSPEWVSGISLPECKGVIAHEVLHVANAHHLRRGGRDPAVWNQACDFAINPILRDAGFESPPGELFRGDLIGKSTEEIFRILTEESTEENSEEESGDGSGSGDKSGDGSESGDGNPGDGSGNPPMQSDPPDDKSPVDGSGGAQNSDESGKSDDSDGSDPEPDPGDGSGDTSGNPGDPDGDSSGGKRPGNFPEWGEVLDATNPDGSDLSRAEREQEISEIGTENMKAIQAGKNQGILPGGLEIQIRKNFDPKVPWESVLHDFVANLRSDDQSWSRPNRRFVAGGLYLPGAVRDRIGEIMIVVDTSGSIDRTQLERAQSEINSIMQTIRPEVIKVLFCDSAVHGEIREFRAGEEIDLDCQGGGGTDFRPPFSLIRDQGLDVSALIYFTDLECTKYPDDPGFPVLWICSKSEESATYYGPPPFGSVVYMGTK